MEIKTWGDALDYTLSTRHSWRHGNGRKTALINANHFTQAVGVSFPVRKIDQALLTRVSIELEDAHKSSATINRVVSAVSTVLNHCADEGLIPKPSRFRRRKENPGRTIFYTKEEVDQLYHASLDPFDRTDLGEIILFAAYTGMRQSEILKLKAKDIDLGLNTVFVGGTPDNTTKSGDWRSIPIHTHIADVINNRLRDKKPHHHLFGTDWLNKDQLLRNFRKVNRFIGKTDDYCFHILRHSFGTWCAEAGVPLRTVMDMMGHKNIDTTLRYAKTTDKARKEAIDLI